MVRKYAYKPDPYSPLDYPYVQGAVLLAAKGQRLGVGLPVAVDLRADAPPIWDQGEEGSCVAHALCGGRDVVEIQAAKRRGQSIEPVLFSRQWLYRRCLETEHTFPQDGGCSLRTGLDIMFNIGVPPEADFPYQAGHFIDVPPTEADVDASAYKIGPYYRISTTRQLLRTLGYGHVCAVGIGLWKSFESDQVASTGIVPMPGSNEDYIGGHAVLLVGYDQADETFLVRNSWGADWGIAGYCKIPFAYFEPQPSSTPLDWPMGYANDCWVFVAQEGGAR